MNKKIIFICLTTSILAIGCTSSTQKPRLKEISYCSDLCPANTRTFTVYEGIKTPEDCDKIKGQVILDIAWGGFIGCGPREEEEPKTISK